MKILKIRIQGQEAVWENPFEIVSGSQNYLYIKPDFSLEWNKLDIKFLFRDIYGNEVWNSEENTNVSDGTEGLIRVPASVVVEPFFVVGVLGYGADNKFVPTASLKIDVTDNGYDAFSKVNGVPEEEKERLAELVLSDFKARMDSYAESMAGYAETMEMYSAQEEDRRAVEGDRRFAERARVNAESLRQGTEERRVFAEDGRVQAEKDREASEESRRNAENDRNAYEDTRVINEEARVAAEKDRRNAEDKRASAESERENGEDRRAGAEVERLSAERERKEAEEERETAEEARVSRENIRGENEASRGIAEDGRVQAENKRVLAEKQRVTSESQRATRWQEMSSDIEGAVQNASEAVLECDEAAGNARNVTGLMANALKGSAIGQSVNLTDVSPIEHTLDVKVQTKNIYPYKSSVWLLEQGTFSMVDNGMIANGNDGSSRYAHSSGWMRYYRKASNMELLTFTKDIVTVSLEVTLIEEGIYGATFKLAPTEVTGGEIFTATTTPTRFSFTAKASDIQKGLYVALNANTLKIANVQFEYGTEATEYAPYMADVSGVSVSKYGANLLPYPYTGGKVENGITFTDNGDGTITANGTATVDSYFRLHTEYELKKGVSYQLKGCPSGGAYSSYNIYAQSNTDSSTSMRDTGAGATFVGKGETNRIIIMIAKGTTVKNMTFRPQLSVGNAEYEPYKEPTTYTVNADGTVEGVTSIYPTTTLLTDTGAVVDVTYNRDINKAFAESQNRIAELEQKLTNAVISLGGNV